MVKPLSKEKREEIEEFLTKGSRGKSNGYIDLILYKKGKKVKIKRSRAYYQYFNRVELNRFDIVHHRDENKANDDIRNLELMTPEEHNSHHHTGKRVKKNKPRVISNKLKDEVIGKIFELSNKKEYQSKSGRINYSKIGRELQISNFTAGKYIKERGNKHGSISPI